MSVIDLGCGNCRFYDFLRNIGRDFTYLGIDSNKGLLEIAVEKFGRENNFSVKEKDLILNLDSISGSFDMAVVFGVMHHLPSENIRNNFIKQAGGLVKNSGVLVLSFWEIENCKEVEIPGLSKSDLDSGDFFLAWKGDKDSVRYVHKYSLNEIENICKLLAQEGFKLESRFIDDFNSKSDNLYLVFRRTRLKK